MKKLTTIAAGCGILTTLALAGCSPSSEPAPTETPATSPAAAAGTATPTPTAIAPEPYVTDPPASAEEAIQFASAADSAYDDAVTALYLNPNTEADLTGLATEARFQKLLDNVAQLVELGAHIEGESTFEIDQAASFTQDTVDQGSGENIPFGMVNLKGCADYSNLELVRTNGEREPFSDPQRVRVTSEVLYSPVDGRWMLVGGGTDDPVTTC